MSNEWYTPTKYIEAARTVMGSIDLDPASCEVANRTVKASRYFTKEDNGLAQQWHGNIWLNPPYSRTENKQGSNIGLFLFRLFHEYEAGRVQQAIALVTSQCDAKWFHLLWEHPICFTDHRVHFITDQPTKKYPTRSHILGAVFVYLGYRELAFMQTFSQFGTIARAVDVPARREVRQLRLVEA